MLANKLVWNEKQDLKTRTDEDFVPKGSLVINININNY